MSFLGRFDPFARILPRLESPAANEKKAAVQTSRFANVGFREGFRPSVTAERPISEREKSSNKCTTHHASTSETLF